jgi:hypothetical protein
MKQSYRNWKQTFKYWQRKLTMRSISTYLRKWLNFNCDLEYEILWSNFTIWSLYLPATEFVYAYTSHRQKSHEW